MRSRWQTERAAANGHADDWLMTYADMITLLLCFFAIFLTVSVPKTAVPQRTELVRIVTVPAQPVDFLEGNLPLHGVARADRPTQDYVPEPALPAKPEPLAAPAKPAEIKAEAPPPPPAPAPEPPRLVTLDTTGITPPAILEPLKSTGNAQVEQKGDRITTVDMSSATFFASGSATISKSGEAILQDVAARLKSDELRDYLITVEGHTDDAPISTAQFPSNWELSTARASAVVHYFLDQGISATKLRAAGYADTFPKAPNRDLTGHPIPENQAQNRRVVIKLEKIDKG
ncbi:MAG TPA: OmpA family protein [Stellaceae bacterium]|nr:OmpA family protein [Stellaceae bacterium]